jgi:hypothetical protein
MYGIESTVPDTKILDIRYGGLLKQLPQLGMVTNIVLSKIIIHSKFFAILKGLTFTSVLLALYCVAHFLAIVFLAPPIVSGDWEARYTQNKLCVSLLID